jgi:hypothetical protein
VDAPGAQDQRLGGGPGEHDRGFLMPAPHGAAGLLLQPQGSPQGELGDVRSFRILARPRLAGDQLCCRAANPDAGDQVRAREQADDSDPGER